MKSGIIVLHAVDLLSHLDLRVQLFPDLPDQSLLGRLPGLDLAAGKFPAVLEFSVASLGGKYLMAGADNGRCNSDCFHV